MTNQQKTRLGEEYGALAALPRDELERLELDEAYFDAMFHTIPQVRRLYETHAALLEKVEAAAAHNMSLRPELEALRSETKTAFERARTAEAEWPVASQLMQEEYKVCAC